MEQVHERPPASLAPGSDSLKGAKETKEAVETKCAKSEGKPEGKPEGGAQGDKRLDLEAGMATAEYAIGTVAAAAFAGAATGDYSLWWATPNDRVATI